MYGDLDVGGAIRKKFSQKKRYEGVDWICVAYDVGLWPRLINFVTKLQVL